MKIVAAAMLLSTGLSQAASEPLKIGFMASLSGPTAVVGQEVKRGLDLALERLEHRIGGVETAIVLSDSRGDPTVASQELSRLIEREGVDVLVGLDLSNVTMAVAQPAAQAGIVVLAVHSGPADLAGSSCHPNIFLTGWQNDMWGASMGEWLVENGVERLFLMGYDYVGSWEIIESLERTYSGEIVGKILTPMSQIDYAAELAQVRAARPDGLFVFYPGAASVAFPRQYGQAGLPQQIPLYSVAALSDPTVMPAQGEAAYGIITSANWNPHLENQANREFVEAFREQHGRDPSFSAAVMYDTVLLLDAAIRASADPSIAEELRENLKTVQFDSIRGEVRIGPNNVMQQPVIIQEAVKNDQGEPTLKPIATTSVFVDPYGDQCSMR